MVMHLDTLCKYLIHKVIKGKESESLHWSLLQLSCLILTDKILEAEHKLLLEFY